jgi:hypothetical protein
MKKDKYWLILNLSFKTLDMPGFTGLLFLTAFLG